MDETGALLASGRADPLGIVSMIHPSAVWWLWWIDSETCRAARRGAAPLPS
jgi:hypothetical protein